MTDIEMSDQTTVNQTTNGESIKEEALPTEEMNKIDNEVHEATPIAAETGVVSSEVNAEHEGFNEIVSKKKMTSEVADSLMKMKGDLNLTPDEFDDRAVELLVTFTPEQQKFIIKEIEESNLYGVQNKLQYIMSVMRNFKDRLRIIGPQQSTTLPLVPGPKVDNIKEIVDRTGYQLEVTVGQRKYFTPLSEDQINQGVDPTNTGGCIYIGQIPKDVYEDTLIPLFEKIGPIYDLRIMMDPINGKSRGYGFLIYFEKSHAEEAAKKYDGHQILPGKALKVNVSVANCRLFIGNIPKSKSKDEILEEFKKHAENVLDIIIYSNPDAPESRKNRGFCFVDFADHKSASDAKRRISMGKIRPWNNDLVVDWAEQQEEPDDEIMAQVKVLYVRNLKESVTEEKLKEMFQSYGEIEKAKRIKDYAFVHFSDRDGALAAMNALHKMAIEGVEIEVSLAKPQNEQKKKKFQVKRGTGEFFPPPMRGGRYDFYPPTPVIMRGGRGSMGGYYPRPYPAPTYTPGPYDPYAYGGEYDYSAYGVYDEYAGYSAEGYYGGVSYPTPRPSVPRGRGMYGRGAGMYGGAVVKRGGSRGVKRAGGDFGGPVSKRVHGHDFASDTF